MKYTRFNLLALLLICFCQLAYTQENNKGSFSGSLEVNGNFFIRDSLIGADNTPQYNNELSGTDSWLNLGYSNWGFDLGLRFDLFNNSNLLNPTGSYTAQGIGYWQIKKKVNKLEITGGNFYDQIGSGIIFRAYEARPLAIDNAMFGIRLAYDIAPEWKIKVFSGKQKQQFEYSGANFKGATVEGFITGGEEANWSLAPGIGVVNRTLSEENVNQLVSIISTYLEEDRVTPAYNSYAFSAFNTLSVNNFSWYLEGAYKSNDIFFDPFADKKQVIGGVSKGKLVKRTGSVIYSSMSWAGHGLGINLETKRTENFAFRADPLLTLNRGLVNFIPPMMRQNTYRLNARYAPATQDIGELAVQADIRYKINKKWSALVNFSNITDLDNVQLYREVFTQLTYKKRGKYTVSGGIQLQDYNQEIYEGKPEVPIVKTITPYIDFLYKFSRKKSLGIEAQYMSTDQDYGSWAFLQAELGLAPNWQFELSGMFNIDPGKNSPTDVATGEKLSLLYPAVGITYTHKSNRFGFRYVKQVEGIVCTGGICRLEPAFSGVKMSVTSIF